MGHWKGTRVTRLRHRERSCKIAKSSGRKLGKECRSYTMSKNVAYLIEDWLNKNGY